MKGYAPFLLWIYLSCILYTCVGTPCPKNFNSLTSNFKIMKTIKIILVALLAVFLGSNSYAQMHDYSKMDMSKTSTNSKMDMSSTKTENIKVWG